MQCRQSLWITSCWCFGRRPETQRLSASDLSSTMPSQWSPAVKKPYHESCIYVLCCDKGWTYTFGIWNLIISIPLTARRLAGPTERKFVSSSGSQLGAQQSFISAWGGQWCPKQLGVSNFEKNDLAISGWAWVSNQTIRPFLVSLHRFQMSHGIPVLTFPPYQWPIEAASPSPPSVETVGLARHRGIASGHALNSQTATGSVALAATATGRPWPGKPRFPPKGNWYCPAATEVWWVQRLRNTGSGPSKCGGLVAVDIFS